jgi:hypothetical protein
MRRNIGTRTYSHIVRVELDDPAEVTVPMPGAEYWRVQVTAATASEVLLRPALEAGSPPAADASDTDALDRDECLTLAEGDDTGWNDSQPSALRLGVADDTADVVVHYVSRFPPVA